MAGLLILIRRAINKLRYLMTEEKKNKPGGRKWDGRSRISTDLYKKNYNEIYRNNTFTKHKRDRKNRTEDSGV